MEQMAQTLIDRANEMLKDKAINAVYQSFKTEEEAKDWLLKAALATLMVPVAERTMDDQENVATFKGCEHLDFAPNYAAKRQQTAMGLFWLRPAEPSMVQFCKKRGRVYGCQACLSAANKQCSDYKEIEHSVSVPLEELNS